MSMKNLKVNGGMEADCSDVHLAGLNLDRWYLMTEAMKA